MENQKSWFFRLLISEGLVASITNEDHYATESTYTTESTNIKHIHGNPDLLVMLPVFGFEN